MTAAHMEHMIASGVGVSVGTGSAPTSAAPASAGVAKVFPAAVRVTSAEYGLDHIVRFGLTVSPNDDKNVSYRLQKRYSEFCAFREQLPSNVKSVVPFPQKYLVKAACGHKLSSKDLEARRRGLSDFMNEVAKAKLVGASNMLRQEFLGIRSNRPVAKLICQSVGSKPQMFCPHHPRVRVLAPTYFGLFGYQHSACKFCYIASVRAHSNGECEDDHQDFSLAPSCRGALGFAAHNLQRHGVRL